MSADQKIVYFLGIGGIGMSALARFYLHQGYRVFGYDLTRSPLTDQLEAEGMKINFDDAIESIPQEVLKNKEVKIIYTPAIPKEHRGFNYLQKEGYPMLKRARVLGDISRGFKTIAIAGTHGKTTTTAICAHIMKSSSIPCVSFVGGLMSGYETNILLDKDPEWIVVEADEFDRSFLQLNPALLGVTSVDADHLDIYNDKDSMVLSFRELCAKIKDKEHLFTCDAIDADLQTNSISYGFTDEADIRISSIAYDKGYHLIKVKGWQKEDVDLAIPMPGKHNALNAVLAALLAYNAGCTIEVIQQSIRSFQGVKRRFEYIINREDLVFIDDYAHHPKEINALIDAVRSLYPGKKISGIFQPHLYSRTRDFADEFAESLSRLDRLYLMEIYPAREKAIPGVDSRMLLEKVRLNEKSIVNKENLPVLISSTNHEILLTIGAGDIALMLPAVKQAVINSIS